MAPELCTERGLTLDEVVEAMLEGSARDRERAAAAGQPIIVQAARDRDAPGGALGRGRRAAPSAGATPGSSASTSPDPRRATRRRATSTRSTSSAARTSTSRSTPASRSGCRRSGRRSSSAARSGWATASGSSTTSRSATTAPSTLGRLAAFVRDRRVPLEMCPTSNVHTGGAPSIAEHPFDLLRRLRFRVTVNTDNRLMSGVSLSSPSSPPSTRRSASASARWSG